MQVGKDQEKAQSEKDSHYNPKYILMISIVKSISLCVQGT